MIKPRQILVRFKGENFGLDLSCLANEAPTELPKDNNDRLLRLLRFPIWLSRSKEVEKRETAENPHSTAA
jgi:hypothetical protein